MTKQVVIVGGGVVGLAAAYHLAERGHAVTVLDRGPACSHGNSGLIVPSHFVPLAAPGMIGLGLRSLTSRESPFWLQPSLSPAMLSWLVRFARASTAETVTLRAPLLRDLHLASRAIFVRWAAAWQPGFALGTDGLLMLCRTAQGLAAEARMADQARALGVPAEVLSAAETARREPSLALDIAGAVYFPLDAHLNPAQLLAALEAQGTRLGVTILRDTPVTGFRTRGRRVLAVETPAGPLEADEIVLAAGFASTAVARGLGLRLPMLPGKGYSLTLTAPRALPKHPAILTEARVAVTPMGDSLRVGGTLELGVGSATLDPRRVVGIVKSFVRYFPDFTPADFGQILPWCGLRPCSPDGLPYLGRFARFDNVVAATGHAMMGVSLGPITGRLVAEIVAGEKTSFDLTALRPDRYL